DADTLVVSLRELPSATLYATFGPRWRLSPYLGLRTGLVSLQGGRYYNGPNSQVKLSGDTFQLGGVAGLVFDVRDFELFGEASYLKRSFDSPEWDAAPPATLRSISFTGAAVAFGLQFHFRDHTGK